MSQWHYYILQQIVFQSEDKLLFSVTVGASVTQKLFKLLSVEPYWSQSVTFTHQFNQCRNHNLATLWWMVQPSIVV